MSIQVQVALAVDVTLFAINLIEYHHSRTSGRGIFSGLAACLMAFLAINILT